MQKFKDRYFKAELFKTKIKCKFKCNNIKISDFIISDNGERIFKTSYQYKNTLIICNLTINKDQYNSFLNFGCTRNVIVRKNANYISILITVDVARHDEYLKRTYSKIPNVIEYNKSFSNDFAKCNVIIQMAKSDYAGIMNYRDKSLPKTTCKKREIVPYKGIPTKPLYGGRFTPK